jgi:hypothetical protein
MEITLVHLANSLISINAKLYLYMTANSYVNTYSLVLN